AGCSGGVGGADGHVADAVGLIGRQTADTVVAVGVDLEIARVGGNGLVGIGADLEGGGGEAAVEQVQAVELGGGGDALQFLRQLLDVGVQRGAVGAGVRGIRRLHGEGADALQNLASGGQGAFGGLGQRDAVVGVTRCLVEAVDLAGHALRNGEAGGVVLGAVD